MPTTTASSEHLLQVPATLNSPLPYRDTVQNQHTRSLGNCQRSLSHVDFISQEPYGSLTEQYSFCNPEGSKLHSSHPQSGAKRKGRPLIKGVFKLFVSKCVTATDDLTLTAKEGLFVWSQRVCLGWVQLASATFTNKISQAITSDSHTQSLPFTRTSLFCSSTDYPYEFPKSPAREAFANLWDHSGSLCQVLLLHCLTQERQWMSPSHLV